MKDSKRRTGRRTPIATVVQEKVEHGGFREEGAPVKSKIIHEKPEPLDTLDHSGTHGEPYRKKQPKQP